VRRFVATLVRRLAEALVRLYWPGRALGGRGRILARRPLVFVVDRPNGLVDALVLRVATGRRAGFLAKSMDAFGSIPGDRAHDFAGRGLDTSRDDDSFARCRAELAAGGALALFPERGAHADPQLPPLKTGAAAEVGVAGARVAVDHDDDARRLRILSSRVVISPRDQAIRRVRAHRLRYSCWACWRSCRS
jgi:hypothetical protein